MVIDWKSPSNHDFKKGNVDSGTGCRNAKRTWGENLWNLNKAWSLVNITIPTLGYFCLWVGWFSDFFFFFFRASPTAYSQARDQVWSCSHWATPQPTATPDLSHVCDLHTAHGNTRSSPTEGSQGLNLLPHGYSSDSFLLSHDGNSNIRFLFLKNDHCYGAQPPWASLGSSPRTRLIISTQCGPVSSRFTSARAIMDGRWHMFSGVSGVSIRDIAVDAAPPLPQQRASQAVNQSAGALTWQTKGHLPWIPTVLVLSNWF